jgi:hypothetical protein
MIDYIRHLPRCVLCASAHMRNRQALVHEGERQVRHLLRR